MAAQYPGDQISDDEGSWFVGELALSQLPSGELLRLRGRTANEATIGNVFRLRLAKVAIGKVLSGIRNSEAVHIRIATGLPVDHMRDASALKAALMGQHLMGEKWQAGKTVDVIYLSGGGSELVQQVVTEAYRQTKPVPQAQLANARGYLNYAHFRTQQ